MRLGYLHLPRFALQRCVAQSPGLKGRPVVLVREQQGTRRVELASAAALQRGVRPGMTLTAAQALEPAVHPLPFSPMHERAALVSLGEALLSLAPAFELCGHDGLWLDASAAALCGDEDRWAARALALVQELGFAAQLAVAPERFTCRALARQARQGQGLIRVEVGGSAEALRPLPLLALAEEGLADAVRALAALGLSTLGEVAALPAGAVVARLSGQGLRALRLSRGDDDTLLSPEPLAPRLEEQVDLGWPAETQEPVLFALKAALDRLCARLSGRGLAAVRLGLSLHLDPAGRARVPLLLSRPSSQVKLLLDLFRHRLAELSVDRPVAGLHLVVEKSSAALGQQLRLSEEPSGDAALEVVLSRLASSLGQEALFSARANARHRPEAAWTPAPFQPPPREVPLAEDPFGLPLAQEPFEPAFRARPARLLSEASPLVAQVDPQGQLACAQLLGKSRPVLALWGPERLVGEWWGDRPFARDYYRVIFEGLGPAWVYRDARDGRYFLAGLFD